MSEILFNISVKRWVRGTIDKMTLSSKTDVDSWSKYWLATYLELGGKSKASGCKGCPLHAAYGLWRLGRIKGTDFPYSPKPIKYINEKYGKNAAYAAIALELLENGHAAKTKEGLWSQVQEKFRKDVHDKPAISQQGSVSIAQGLFEAGEIVTNIYK